MTRGNKIQKTVQAYINRINSTRLTPVSQQETVNIVNWFNGLEMLGFFDSLYEAYLMSSLQNAGTGTKLFGLMGKFNGTLINGPTWSAQGLIFNGSTTRIEWGNPPELLNLNALSVLTFADKVSLDTRAIYGMNHGDAAPGAFMGAYLSNSYAQCGLRTDASYVAINGSNTDCISMLSTYDGANLSLYSLNSSGYHNEGSTAATGVVSFNAMFNNQPFYIGQDSVYNGGPNFNGTVSSYFFFLRSFTFSEYQKISNLYLATIGKRGNLVAQDYINRVNALRSSPLPDNEVTNIYNWFNGLESLYLLDKIVDGWTLRSTQNVGTGSTLVGFFGNDGTLSNGPTWGTNGITFDYTSSQYIFATIPTQSSSVTDEITLVTSSAITNIPPPNYPSVCQLGAVNGSSPGFIVIAGTDQLKASCYTAGTDGAGTFINTNQFFGAVSFRSSTKETFLTYNGSDSNLTVTDAFSWSDNTIYMGHGAGGHFLTGNISMNIAFKKIISTTLLQQIRTLYKNTIGQGLSLP